MSCFGRATALSPYWSNRSPEKWANDGCQVNIIEVKGAGHRTINEQAAAHFSVIMHVADEPDVTLRIEELLITDPFDKVAAKKNPYDKKKMSPTQVGTFLGQTSSADALKVYVRVDFGGQKVETAAVLMDQCTGRVTAEQLFGSTREFVFDPTYQVEATVKVKTWKGMWAGAGSKLAGTKSVKINFYEMITASTTKGLIELKFAEGVTVKLSVVGFEAGEKAGLLPLGQQVRLLLRLIYSLTSTWARRALSGATSGGVEGSMMYSGFLFTIRTLLHFCWKKTHRKKTSRLTHYSQRMELITALRQAPARPLCSAVLAHLAALVCLPLVSARCLVQRERMFLPHKKAGKPPRELFSCRTATKKERKKTYNPREGWENGTPPPHRDFKERSVMR